MAQMVISDVLDVGESSEEEEEEPFVVQLNPFPPHVSLCL
jgi:hypothetical protein